MTETVLGVDPGGNTGLCLLRVGVNIKTEVVDFGQVTWPEILGVAESWVVRCDAVACERYTITARTATLTRQPEAMYVIGMLYFLAQAADVPMLLQSPGDAKAAFGNDRLKDLGLKVTGRHAKDALRHACLLVRRAYKTTTTL
jgi:hypothetical protein